MSSVEPNKVWRIADVLNWSTDYLKEKGSESARLDAELLISKAIGCQRLELYTNYEQPLANDERRSIRDNIQRRAKGEPVAYILGHRSFWKHDFVVDTNVLIPRPETELIIESAIESLDIEAGISILDVGVGSGCISISLASEFLNARIEGWDICESALQIARTNETNILAESRVDWICKDALVENSWLEAPKFDLIVSNPPYVCEGFVVNQYEPAGALYAGKDGYTFYEAMSKYARHGIKNSGWLMFEIGLGQQDRVVELLNESGWRNIEIKTDLANIPRLIVAQQ